MFVLSRMVHWRLLPDITWGFVGDPSQPQQLGHWRGVTCRNGLMNQANCLKWSSYLPEKIIEKTIDKRSKCPILRDFRKRLREADQSQVPAFIEEGRSLFKADPPYETSIVVSNAKRRRICEKAQRNGNKNIQMSPPGGSHARILRGIGFS